MTHACLLFHRYLAEGPAELSRLEVRIIAEAARAARRECDDPLDFTAFHKFVRAVVIRRGAHVARATIRIVRESLEQQRVVRVVERLAPQVATSAPPLTPDSRRAAQREHLDAGVVGHSRRAGPLEEMTRLQPGVLLEAVRAF